MTLIVSLLYLSIHSINHLGTVLPMFVPIRGKQRAPLGQAQCPTWASSVPILEHKTVEAQVSRSVLETGKSMEFLPV